VLKGQALFFDAFIPHSSTPNNSGKRRCAWIVRYIPRDTEFVENNRNDFQNHELMSAN
jgi:ectoine hydroxylase-related dioxygenase (phytanoyl-CoA dioxygenase family)